MLVFGKRKKFPEKEFLNSFHVAMGLLLAAKNGIEKKVKIN